MKQSLSKFVFVFDLDDTLYNEMDFVLSGFHYVSNYFNKELRKKYHIKQKVNSNLLYKYFKNNPSTVFNQLSNDFGPFEIDILVDLYRKHFPKLKLSNDTKTLLEYLKSDTDLSIITDGSYKTQANKIKALKLDRYFQTKHIFINDRIKHHKPSEYSFKVVENTFPNKKYIYIADNNAKDFIAPNNLGWETFHITRKKAIYPIKKMANKKYYADYKISKLTDIIENFKDRK